ncbi:MULTISPECIES: glutamine amidotransferase-related protein [Xanthocytophaga]|nr:MULTISPECIES: GMP synthase [Xanthocytophaga]
MRIAILDLYDGSANEGIRCIKELMLSFAQTTTVDVSFTIFDVRQKNEIPDLSYDLYISTGGPGSPVESEGTEWELLFFELMNNLRDYNRRFPEHKKYVFLISHSFQIFCRYFELGVLTQRKSHAFGIFPVHRTVHGLQELYFENLDDPFWVVDSRDWQVTQINEIKLKEWGGQILCYEKLRPLIDLERAVMAIRFDEAFFGTQFHPEIDAAGMLRHLDTKDKREIIIANYGIDKYHEMIRYLADPDKIAFTYQTILPTFLRIALPHSIEL